MSIFNCARSHLNLPSVVKFNVTLLKSLYSSSVYDLSSLNSSVVPKESDSCKLPQLTIHEALKCKLSEKLSLKGWIRSHRRLKEHHFMTLNDGLSPKNIQIVVPTILLERKGVKPQFGSSICCKGSLVESRGPEQPLELYCEDIDIIGQCNVLEYPFNPNTSKNNNWNGMREHIHLRPRASRYASLMRLRSDLNFEIHNLMKESGYFNVTTPILTKNECEGGSKPFSVKPIDYPDDVSFFKGKAKLTVSAQLHLETAACALSRVYTLGPTFRAEVNKSRRHLSEFTMFELEEAFIDDLDVLMDKVEFIVKSLASKLIDGQNENYLDVLKSTKYDLTYRLLGRYIRLTYDDAIEIINKKQDVQPAEFGKDLSAFHETVLLEYFEHQPLFITHFPSEIRPFYMKSDGDRALCFDLLGAVGGEICGGSLREDNYDKLKSRMDEVEGLTEELDWYLDLRKYGNVPHGGCGFGFDRLIQTITGLSNIKDVVPYPRFLYHCPL
ncbi:probable asparagine--tRNA ligase, mitochondrial [Tetranychus urticae]|uniref:asparagine--tRNA ligase n=1 Tax=Tetranychus urticae TaxID=32264 RepID=T1KFG1_TETUR|nr:probable asparagine--tRNA ligase, mitochondrial [Tetranychus urticae]